ncbi:MAG: nucleotidyltransferase family protein [Chloroflexota bacterium]|nr:nucleotidyltransferase family protein [Chloroflexota bacterium]
MNSAVLPVSLAPDAIRAFCDRHHIRRLALFGSVLRTDFTPESDIDVLVEFDPIHTPGLIGFYLIQEELAAMVGREVDLLTFKSLHPMIRDSVLREAQTIYVTA